jgi:hypothetical protein
MTEFNEVGIATKPSPRDNSSVFYQVIEIIIGNSLIVVSALLYSSAWILNNGSSIYPDGSHLEWFILGAIFTGMIGAMFLTVATISLAMKGSKGCSTWFIPLLGFVGFATASFLTRLVYHRLFTAELLFLFVWFTIELTMLLVLLKQKIYLVWNYSLNLLLLLVVLGFGLYCYTTHYELSGAYQFMNGLLPYIAAAVFMILQLLLTLVVYPRWRSIQPKR